ncbi:MAG: MmcQ/YjbR family DNA-binding protein [Chloroflexia bacterium]|nr:MmcQ/YjbR family DNA-binding protein [Chloroflexia bacterium]
MANREALLHTLHEICMEYPGAEEIFEGSVGDPVYKVSGRIYVMQHQLEGSPSIWMKAPPGVQEALVASDPDRYFRPPYVGHNGWVGAWLTDGIDWPEVEDLIDDAWRMTAKKSLIREYDATRKESSAS